MRRIFTRLMLATVTAGSLFALETGFDPVAQAAAPLQRQQVPGYYRVMLGDYEVTALLDGTHTFPVEVLTKTSERRIARLLKDADVGLPVEGPINAFLLNTGEKLILIDSGAGALYGADGGHLLENLYAAGYKAEEVDEVYLTHLHKDHVGGINNAGQRAFPNATVYVNRVDADYWLSHKRQEEAPEFLRSMFDGAIESLKPYADAGRLRPFDIQAPPPGVLQPLSSPGHTPGHTWYSVESKGNRIVFWGDAVHVAPIQFPEPAVGVKYDSDQAQAEHERKIIFEDASAKGYVIAAAHISFPGLGHIRKGNARFEWLPVSFTKRLGSG